MAVNQCHQIAHRDSVVGFARSTVACEVFQVASSLGRNETCVPGALNPCDIPFAKSVCSSVNNELKNEN
jgi:hypothetical protein